MAFSFITDEGETQIGSVPKEEPASYRSSLRGMKPRKDEQALRAAARGTAEGALGSYGNILSLIPGYPSGQQLPGHKAKHELESKASDIDLALLNIDSDEGVFYPPLPTSSQVSQILEQYGIPKKEETPGEKGAGRFGRLFGGAAVTPGVGLGTAASTAFTGAGAGELTRKAGFGEKTQAAAEILGGLRFRGKPITPTEKIRQPRISKGEITPRKTGFISEKLLNQRLEKVGEEAAELASTIGKEHPTFQRISKAIEEGVPIQKRFDEKFSSLEELAKHVEAPVNSKPLDSFLVNEAHKYTGIGEHTDLSKFVTDQINGWQKNGGNSLYKMMRRYRLNNEKLKEIRQSAPPYQKLTDADRQKINFLTRMNDSIKESMKSTFGETKLPAIPGEGGKASVGQKWFKGFEQLNDAYSGFKNTETAKRVLDPILKNQVSETDLGKFLSNQRNWEDLNRFLGPEETQKLHTLVEDVVKARNALKSIPKGDINKELTNKLLFNLIPGVGSKISGILSLPKLWDWAKGRYYSAPEFQQNFHELVQGLVENNIQAVNLAASKIKAEEKPKKRKFEFIESTEK